MKNNTKLPAHIALRFAERGVDTDKIVTVTDAADGSPSIEPGTIGDIKTSKSYGADASRVFIHASYNKPVFIVIYNN